jgi:hypothetical protein
MKKFYRATLLAIIFLPFCASDSRHNHVAISGKEVSLAVQLDVLKTTCERRLSALEADTQATPRKRATAPNFGAVRASDPVRE